MGGRAMANQITFGEVVGEAGELLRRHPVLLSSMSGAIVAIYVAIDLLPGASDPTTGNISLSVLASILVSIFAQYYLIEQLLRDRLLLDGTARKRRYGAIVSSSLLSGIAILFGFLFFIVPGVIMLSRWALTTPYVVVEECGGVRAMERSWEGTAQSKMTMFLLYLIYSIGFLAMIGGVFSVEVVFGSLDSITAIFATNIFGAVFSVAGWLLAAAAYRRIETSNATLDDIFA